MSDIIEIGGPADAEESGAKKKMPKRRRTECERCGECCRANTPSILKQDFGLFLDGILTPDNTFTVRIGEPLKSPGDNETYQSTMELVKIKPGADSGECPFFDEDTGCTIYDRRPAQCADYACWQLPGFMEGLEEQALTRREIFGPAEAIMDIIRNHQEKCSYDSLAAALEKAAGGDEQAMDEILDMLHYDTFLRPQLASRLSLPEEAFDLILGRPLFDTVKNLGYTVDREGDDIVLRSIRTDGLDSEVNPKEEP